MKLYSIKFSMQKLFYWMRIKEKAGKFSCAEGNLRSKNWYWKELFGVSEKCIGLCTDAPFPLFYWGKGDVPKQAKMYQYSNSGNHHQTKAPCTPKLNLHFKKLFTYTRFKLVCFIKTAYWQKSIANLVQITKYVEFHYSPVLKPVFHGYPCLFFIFKPVLIKHVNET